MKDKFPYVNPEARQEMKDAMKEQALNNIYEDADRIEKIIEENSDIIQDIFYCFNESLKFEHKPTRSYAISIAGERLIQLIERKIDYLADEDVEHQI